MRRVSSELRYKPCVQTRGPDVRLCLPPGLCLRSVSSPGCGNASQAAAKAARSPTLCSLSPFNAHRPQSPTPTTTNAPRVTPLSTPAFLPWGAEDQGERGQRACPPPREQILPHHPAEPRRGRASSQGAQKPAALSKSLEQAFCIYSPKCVAELRSSPWLPAICREKSS